MIRFLFLLNNRTKEPGQFVLTVNKKQCMKIHSNYYFYVSGMKLQVVKFWYDN